MIGKSWKTTAWGAASLVAIAAKAYAAGHLDFESDGPAIMAAIGLLFSKDFNASHSKP